MKVAVTGATGFVGSHLVDRLLAYGHKVIAIRHSRPSDTVEQGGVQVRAAAVNDQQALRAAFEGAEAVVHLVGIIIEQGGKTFQKTVAEGTRTVVTAAKEAGVRRLVYLSAMGTSENAPSKYHQSKYQAEQAAANSGLEYVILRPSLIYGPGDGFVSMLEGMIRKAPVLPVIGDGQYQMQPIHIDDVTKAMAKSLEQEKVLGKTIELGGPEKLEYDRILTIIMETIGKRRPRIHLPMGLMHFVAGLLEHLPGTPPLTRDQITMMKMGNTGDNTLMKELLEISPVSFAEGLRRYLK